MAALPSVGGDHGPEGRLGYWSKDEVSLGGPIMGQVPDEVLLQIFQYAHEPRLAGVCRRFYCVLNDHTMFLPMIRGNLSEADFKTLVGRVTFEGEKLTRLALRERIWAYQVVSFQEHSRLESREWNDAHRELADRVKDDLSKFDVSLFFRMRRACSVLPGFLHIEGNRSPALIYGIVYGKETRITDAVRMIPSDL